MKVTFHVFARDFELDFDETTTVGELKAILVEKSEIPANQQFWIHLGRRIEGDDSKTLSELGVKDGGKVIFTIPPRGG